MKTLLLSAFLMVTASCFGSTDCQSTFTAHNQSQITWCVTANGNVVQLEGPPTWTQIQGVEGYGICVYQGNSYWDLGAYGDSGNWKPSVITQPKGPNTLPLTISRATSDNQFTLTQTFKWVASGKTVAVTMTILGPAVTLVRFAEVVPHEYALLGNHTNSASFIWSEGIKGLMANATTHPQVHADIVAGGAQNPCLRNGTSGLALLESWFMVPRKQIPAYLEYSPMR